MRLLHAEMQILIDWQERKEIKKPVSGKIHPQASGKRSKTQDEKPAKKFKDSGKGSQNMNCSSRTKSKNVQAKLQEYDFTDSPVDTPRMPKNDAPNRFWALVDPYCAEILPDDLKFLEDLIKIHDDDSEYQKIPALGKHYSIKWAQEDMLEEQKEGSKIGDKRRGLSNSSSLNSCEAEKLLKKAERECDDDKSPFGSLTQRLVNCLIEENMMTNLDDNMMDSEGPDGNASSNMGKSFIKSLNISNTSQLERRIKRELEEQGILDVEEPLPENPDDEILAELRRCQAELKQITTQNLQAKRRLHKLAKEEMQQQDLRKKLQIIDSEVMEVYRKMQITRQKKKTPTKKEKDQAWKLLRDRENLINLIADSNCTGNKRNKKIELNAAMEICCSNYIRGWMDRRICSQVPRTSYSSMAKKGDSQRTFSVAVVGLSGTEKEKGSAGIGKSCLCNRFTRPLADEYYTDHISVLSQSDFSGRVVNNDHFLYWGEVTKTSEEGVDLHFAVIEQTEFIDDSSFQPFKSGKTEPYIKRCSSTKLQSAEKLMYICKNQLGIEKEYEQKVMPEGRTSVDGFVCVLDVSLIPNRTIERQIEYVVMLLNNLMKTKKPVVLATSKNDEANEHFVKEAEKLVNRKEFRGAIPIVETSAHENINVELAFIILAQMIDRTRGRSKIIAFSEAARSRREVLDVATEAYHSLIRSQVNDYRAIWSTYSKKLAQNQDFIHFCELFGQDVAQKEFRRHIKKLKEDYILKKKQSYLEDLPEVLQVMLPDLKSVDDGDWGTVRQQIRENNNFNEYFVEAADDMPWHESELVDSVDARIPFDLLDDSESEMCYRNHVNNLEADQKRTEMRQQFKRLLEETGYVTPGKSLSEVHVLLMGRECYEALSDIDRQEMYDMHQKEIIERARHNFQELLLEHAECFYRFTSAAPTGTMTQDDINQITDTLQEDSRYKSLDRLDQERKLMLLRHLGFVHCPFREHCPSYPNCMDCFIERVVATKSHRPISWTRTNQFQVNTDSNQINLVLLGSDGLADDLATEIRGQCEDDEYEMDNVLYALDYRIIDGDVNLPQNSFRTSDFLPHGCFCVYSSTKTLEYVRESLEKTLLSNLEQEDRLPFQGLPIVILFAADPTTNEKDLLCLKEEGQTLADNLQCPFIDITGEDAGQQFNEAQLRQALRSLVESIQHRAGFLNIYHSLPEAAEPDIRIIMCMFCGDPYTAEHVLGPLLNHQCCFTSGDRSIILETFLGESKKRVEVIVSSYHGANAFREELVHASLATLSAFSMNIPNLPIQILAVTDSGGANAFFSSDLSHTLITEGNAVADRLQAHFMTATPTCHQKTAFYTPFFKEVWEKKPEIEQAFNMEEPSQIGTGTLQSRCASTIDRRTLPLHSMPPPPPHRRESYHIRPNSADGSADSESHYERLPTDGSQGDDLEDPLSPTFVDVRPLSPSDDSDLYSNVYTQKTGASNQAQFLSRIVR
uniref:Rho GTPase-activating protein 190 n=1 Tax=Strigamia maritima TaxID=126957 RepID=T1J1J5_STRMM